MSPLRGLVLALTAVSAVGGVLRVPWETAFSHPPGSVHVPTALVHPHSPLWSPPAGMTADELAVRMRSGGRPPGGAEAVRRIRWDHWLAELLSSWALLGAAAWPFLALAALRLPSCRPAARFSLGLLASVGLCALLWVAGGGWGPPAPAGFALAGILVARAAASPEAGVPWLGMSPGLRPLGILAAAVTVAAALAVATLLLAGPTSQALALVPVTLGFAVGLALAPTDGVARAAWHLGATLAVVGAGEFAIDAFNRLTERFSLGLSLGRLPGESARGLLALLFLAGMIALAALTVAGIRRLRRRFSACAA